MWHASKFSTHLASPGGCPNFVAISRQQKNSYVAMQKLHFLRSKAFCSKALCCAAWHCSFASALISEFGAGKEVWYNYNSDITIAKCRTGHAAESLEYSTGQPWSIYDYPALYDAAFSYRDYDKEAQFLEEVHDQINGTSATSFLELGCGCANHSISLASKGHTVHALDTSEAQLQHAQQKADKKTAAVTFLHEDMRDFTLPTDEKVDVIMQLLGTVNHLQTNEDVQACWDSCLQVLKPGGLLVVETMHPQDVFDGTFAEGEYWEQPLAGDQHIIMEFGTDDDFFDPQTQVLKKRIGVSVRRDDEIDLQGEGFVWQRIFTLQELTLLAESVGFEIRGAYGDLDLSIDVNHSEATRLVLCLHKPKN